MNYWTKGQKSPEICTWSDNPILYMTHLAWIHAKNMQGKAFDHPWVWSIIWVLLSRRIFGLVNLVYIHLFLSHNKKKKTEFVPNPTRDYLTWIYVKYMLGTSFDLLGSCGEYNFYSLIWFWPSIWFCCLRHRFGLVDLLRTRTFQEGDEIHNLDSGIRLVNLVLYYHETHLTCLGLLQRKHIRQYFMFWHIIMEIFSDICLILYFRQVRNYTPVPTINNSIKVSGLHWSYNIQNW